MSATLHSVQPQLSDEHNPVKIGNWPTQAAQKQRRDTQQHEKRSEQYRYCRGIMEKVEQTFLARSQAGEPIHLFPEAAHEVFKELPLLRQAPAELVAQLFCQKLMLCSINFDFRDQQIHLAGKDLKRNALLELVDYVNTDSGQKIFAVDGMIRNVVDMIRSNILRSLQRDDCFAAQLDDDSSICDPSWPHLQVVYEFFLRFVVSQHVSAKIAKRQGGFDQNFCATLVALFDSEDAREREYLKNILHRVYGKFMSHRAFLRRTLANTFLQFSHVSHHHNGIAELLEILGSIVNGFALPLKQEHQVFLFNVLLPLHTPQALPMYHPQLMCCILQYIEKDVEMCVPILDYLLSVWPWSQSSKQLLFLNELEEVMQLLPRDRYSRVRDKFLPVLAKSAGSQHFQVVERTLLLWNNETLQRNCLCQENTVYVLPIVFTSIYESGMQHWNPTVRHISGVVSMLYQNENPTLWNETKRRATKYNEDKELKEQERKKVWDHLRKQMSSREIENK